MDIQLSSILDLQNTLQIRPIHSVELLFTCRLK
jgi:hypothetical protein